jgi:hypothetical protein
MRAFGAVALTLLLSAPLSGQDFRRPEGWHVRFDSPTASEADLKMFVEMPPGWHLTSGPAAVYWGPDSLADGDFRIEMDVFLFEPEEHREAFGLFFGGAALETERVSYSYFLIRDGGQFTVRRRDGGETVTLLPWTRHDAIRSYADRGVDTSVENLLAVDTGHDTVRFFVNEREVASLPRADLTVSGTYGFRVNHRLNLHISRLSLTPR